MFHVAEFRTIRSIIRTSSPIQLPRIIEGLMHDGAFPKSHDKTNLNIPALYLQIRRFKSFAWQTVVCAFSSVLPNKMQDKVKLSLCLTKHHAIKTYGGVEV
jgi:hypothetical protein